MKLEKYTCFQGWGVTAREHQNKPRENQSSTHTRTTCNKRGSLMGSKCRKEHRWKSTLHSLGFNTCWVSLVGDYEVHTHKLQLLSRQKHNFQKITHQSSCRPSRLGIAGMHQCKNTVPGNYSQSSPCATLPWSNRL